MLPPHRLWLSPDHFSRAGSGDSTDKSNTGIFHHTQPVSAITDAQLTPCENSLLMGQCRGVPSSKTARALPQTISAFFENRDSTRKRGLDTLYPTTKAHQGREIP